MRDPRPMVEGEGTDFERQLLSAARQEEPSPEMLHRMERGLGIASIGVAASAGAAAIATAGTTTAKTARLATGVKTLLFAAKSAGFLALVVGGVIGARLWLAHPAPAGRHIGEVAPVASALVATEGPPASAPPRFTAPSAGRAPVAPATSATANRPSRSSDAPRNLSGEITLIDGARQALSAGAPEQAMRLLHQYNVRYPKGMLMPEALVVRIEALDRSGQHARARALARAFVADHPNSPLADRVARLPFAPGAR